MTGAAGTGRLQPAVIDVSAPCGTVRGRVEEGVATFRGIRYAAAPTGQLRFAPPQPASAENGIIDAARFGLISLQDIDPLPKAIPGAEHNFYAPGGRTYLYEFAWGWPARGNGVGAAHLADLPYFFGNLHQPGVREFLGCESAGPAAAEVARQASAAVAQFVSTGDLTSGLLAPWPAFTPDDRVTMVIDRHPAAVTGHLAERLDFWEAHRADTAAPLDSIGTGR